MNRITEQQEQMANNALERIIAAGIAPERFQWLYVVIAIIVVIAIVVVACIVRSHRILNGFYHGRHPSRPFLTSHRLPQDSLKKAHL